MRSATLFVGFDVNQKPVGCLRRETFNIHVLLVKQYRKLGALEALKIASKLSWAFPNKDHGDMNN